MSAPDPPPAFRPLQAGDRVRWQPKGSGAFRYGTVTRVHGAGRQAVAEVRQDGGAHVAIAVTSLRRPGEPVRVEEQAIEPEADGAEQERMF